MFFSLFFAWVTKNFNGNYVSLHIFWQNSLKIIFLSFFKWLLWLIFKIKFHFFLENAFILAVDWDVKLAFLQEFLLRFRNLLFYNWIFQKNWSLKSNSLYDAQYFKLQYFYTGYCTPPKTSVNFSLILFHPQAKNLFFSQKNVKNVHNKLRW